MNPTSPVLPHSQIQERARTLWLAAGAPAGRDVHFWLEAERQLQVERLIDSPEFRTSPQRRPEGKAAGDEIDPDALADRLDNFGEPARRSPTSLGPS